MPTSRENDLELAINCAANSLAADAALLLELAQGVAMGDFGSRYESSLEELLLGCANHLQALRAELWAELRGGE